MKKNKLHFLECHIAGRQYYDADEAWDELKVGMELGLERDTDNKYDGNAVAIMCGKYHLGYVPRGVNNEIAGLMDMGWGGMFECRLSRKNEDRDYEDQLHVNIRIKRRK